MSLNLTEHGGLQQPTVMGLPANPTVQPELARLLHAELVTVCTGRFSFLRAWDQRQRMQGYVDLLVDTLVWMAVLESIFFAFTGSTNQALSHPPPIAATKPPYRRGPITP